MRRALPVLVLLAVALVAVLLARPAWLGLGGSEGGPPAGEVSPLEETTAGPGGLAGRGTRVLPEDDPPAWEGDPVGVADARLGGASVAGRVTGAGEPLRFARVVPVLEAPHSVAVRTRKDGTFELRGLPPGETDLRVAADGWWSRTARTPALEEGGVTQVGDIDLKARPPASEGLEVKVLDAAGRPVAGAKVTATTMTYYLFVTMGPRRAGVTDVVAKDGATDDLGVARLAPLPPEKYDVIVQAPGFVLEAVENVTVAAGRVEHVSVSLRPGLSVSGTVVDLEGKGVAGAFVTALGVPSFRGQEVTTTDGSGRFVLGGLVPGNYWVMAGHDDRGDGQATDVKAGQQGVRVELKGVGRLAGRVVRADGAPAPRFTLRPYPAQPFRYLYSRAYEVSDAEGRFSIPLAPGIYKVDARAEGSGLTTVPSVTVTLGATTDLTIKVAAQGVVRGVVTDADGNHLAGAEAYVKTGGFPPVPVREQYARADAEGRFVLGALPLEATKIHVRHAAYAPEVVDVTPAPEGQGKEVTVRLSRGARVVGRVTTAEGAAVAGERMNLMQGFALFDAKTAFTDADGRYEFVAVAPGDYSVSTGRFEANAPGQRQSVKVPKDGVATADFVVGGAAGPTGAVEGRVTLAGAPQAGASVTAVDDRGFEAAVSATTDADGRYRVAGLRTGRVTVSVSTSSGLQSSDSVRIQEAGQTVRLDVVFGSCTLRATLVGAEGQTTVSGAWVQVEDEGAAGERGAEAWRRVQAVVQSDNAGVVAVQGLEAGTYRLRVQGTGFALLLTAPFSLAEGESRDLGSVRLQPGGGISGRVTDEAGSPIEGIGVSLRDGQGREVFTFSLVSTGSNGRYDVQGVELGAYTLRFAGKGYAPAERPAVVSGAGAVVDVVLSRGGAVSARVEDEAGQPIEGARLVLIDAQGREVVRTLTIANLFDDESSRTSAQGAARVKDLAPGGYRVTARKDGWAPAGDPLPVTVAGGSDAQVRIVLRPAGS